jgi:hypothetical protein
LYRPGETTLEMARAQAAHATEFLFVISLAAYAALAWQIAFPLYAWRPRWRPVLLGGALVGWLGTAFLYRLPLVGPALFIGCLAFVSAEGWLRLFSRLARLPGLAWLAHEIPELVPVTKSEAPAVETEASETYITVGHR